MRAHQVHLHLANLVPADTHVAQPAHTSGDRIRNLVICDEIVYDRASTIDNGTRVWIKQHRTALGRYFPDRFKGEIVSVDVKSFHFQVSGGRSQVSEKPTA